MKNISLHRIGLLFKRYFRENWKKDLGVVVIVFLFEMILSAKPVTSEISVGAILVLCVLYSGRIYGMLGKSQTAINYLLLPATTSEKVITNIGLSNFYYPMILLIASCLGIFTSTFSNALLYDSEIVLKQITMGSYVSPIYRILSIILVNSVMMFGSVYFRNKAIIKTLLCWMAYCFTIGFIFLGIFGIAYKHAHIMDFSSSIFEIDFIEYIVTTVIIIFFWVLTYFRLKETEA